MSRSESDTDLGDFAPAGVGLSDPSIAQGRRAMLDLVNRLQKTGVQLDIDLPRIAVIGSQSAGKSSLIESISGVSLPRSSGTCTRCPTECRLSRSDEPWKCTVELRFIKDKHGVALGQPRTEVFGDAVSEKADVEDRIRRAQRAILNPSKPAASFLEDDIIEDGQPHELSFSMNYISLSISGICRSSTSRVRLIASVRSGASGNDDIRMVETLITYYISKPSCLILLTVNCETDFENQGAHHLTKQYDPEGKRTVGVLTKPDRIQSGDEEVWLPLLRNEQEPLENNWYTVKQPTTKDITDGVTWAQAREREKQFFLTKAPWSSLDSMYHKYLGTANLVERLSTILSDLISKRLPGIHIELDKCMQQARVGIDMLPKPPSSDPVAEVAAMLSAFVQDLHQMVDGVPQVDGLIQRIRPAQDAFRRAIQRTVPNFCALEGSMRADDASLELLSEASTNEKEEDEEASGDAIYVDEVAKRANDARARELPGHHPFFVQVSYIKEFTTQWDAPAHLLCRSISATLGEHVKALVSKHFAAFGQGGLENRVMILVQQHLKKRANEAHALIDKLIALEKPAPMTLNEHYLSDYKAKYLGRYRSARKKAANGTFSTHIGEHQPRSNALLHSPMTTIESILGDLARIGLPGLKAEDLAKLLPTDEMEAALEIMADVRAYFQVAYKRVTDNVPLAVDYELVRGVGRDLLPLLYHNLGVGGVEGARICKELAQESPSVANKRAELTKKMERLQSASDELVRIEL
ncbi:hypothetical protein MKEN_00541200 [Mycena kentingensis (nom. inval.)]|nr:hypothetical protein MKEN_00541200 [Mycena kentingensis (nom. inval.)]